MNCFPLSFQASQPAIATGSRSKTCACMMVGALLVTMAVLLARMDFLYFMVPKMCKPSLIYWPKMASCEMPPISSLAAKAGIILSNLQSVWGMLVRPWWGISATELFSRHMCVAQTLVSEAISVATQSGSSPSRVVCVTRFWPPTLFHLIR